VWKDLPQHPGTTSGIPPRELSSSRQMQQVSFWCSSAVIVIVFC
jgi:hypothetical protein